MRYSQLFGKTLKTVPAEAEAVSHKLLTRAGFIDRQLSAGIYSFLPLGWRVHQKICEIIRFEMNAIGGQEIFLPTLQPKELWLKSGRWDEMDPPLFTVKDRHGKELALGSTHEEVITDLVSRFIQSYKDLPLALYQIQNKFRNEMRSTGGLLRVREFMMKDLYSFHASEEDLEAFYLKVINAYRKIFQRCGFTVKVAEASSGSIGGSQSHEFQMLCATGEDQILYCEKCDWASSKEKAEKCPLCGGKLQTGKCIENGHVFKLGVKYAEKLGAYFTDSHGRKKPIIMGCYGIGIGRLMATVVEVHHDNRGIIWPKEIAPYTVSLISLGPKSQKQAEQIYEELQKAGIEVLYDDREISAGEKFADCDLIGNPIRLVVSEKTFQPDQNKIEWKKREQENTELLSLKEVIDRLTKTF